MPKPAESVPSATPRPRGRASDAARFARMAGSSIAAPSAAGWVTDFLNAAYFARREADRAGGTPAQRAGRGGVQSRVREVAPGAWGPA